MYLFPKDAPISENKQTNKTPLIQTPFLSESLVRDIDSLIYLSTLH